MEPPHNPQASQQPMSDPAAQSSNTPQPSGDAEVAQRPDMIEVDSEQMLRSQTFPRWLVFSIVFVAGATLLTAVVLILYERKWFEPPARSVDSYSRDAIGHRAFFEVMSRLKIKPLRYRKERRLETLRAPVFVVMPGAANIQNESGGLRRGQPIARKIWKRTKKALKARLKGGLDTVLVLPKWSIEIDPGGGVAETRLMAYKRVARNINRLLPKGLTLPDLHRLDSRGESTWKTKAGAKQVSFLVDAAFVQSLVLSSANSAYWKTRVGTEQRSLVSVFQDSTLGEGRLFVVADPDLISNFRMALADHTYLFYWMIREQLKTDTIIFDEATHGHVQRSSLRDEMGRFPNVLFVIHAILLLFLMAWHGWLRFGVPLLPQGRPRRGPKEVLAITARVLADGKRKSALTSSYLLCMLEDIAGLLDFEQGSLLKRCEKIDSWCAKRSLPMQAVGLYRRAMQLRSQRHKSAGEVMRLAHQVWELREVILQTRWKPS